MASLVNIDEFLEAETHYWNKHYSFIDSACLECAVNLGIPEILHKNLKPITLSQLTAALPIDPSKSTHICRLMRVLVNAGFFSEQKSKPTTEKAFSLTFAGRFLLKDVTPLTKAMNPLVLYPSLIKPWSFLTEWFKNQDQTPFVTAYGKSFWELFGEDPKLRNLFNDAMAGESEFTARLLTERCGFTFEGLKSLVDVGGGTGTTTRAIAKKFPGLECTVFDLPHVVGKQQGMENLKFVAGSMFGDIPQANAVMLKWILHNWVDEDCIKILKNCKKAISTTDKGGKLIVVDIAMASQEGSDDNVAKAQTYFDLQMLLMFNSKERTEKELAALFEKAGFSGYKVFPLLGIRSLIEVYP